jgi:translation elongation factor EF-Ts
MSEITLEKVDIVRERTGVTYAEAKEALESCDGNVVDALVYLEGKDKNDETNEVYTTKDEFINWVKDLINKGNITRIKIKKDEKVIVDLPINAGIAVAGLAYLVWAPLLALGILTAVVTKITIEITKNDGSVEVVNKIIKTTMTEVKDKFSDLTDGVKDKFSNISEEVKDKVTDITEDVKDKFASKAKSENTDTNVYKYTVKFDDVSNDNVKDENEENQL